jgi:hypothetical protein
MMLPGSGGSLADRLLAAVRWEELAAQVLQQPQPLGSWSGLATVADPV